MNCIRFFFLPHHVINHFMPLVSLKTPCKQKKQSFSDAFRGYQKRSVAWNGLSVTRQNIHYTLYAFIRLVETTLSWSNYCLPNCFRNPYFLMSNNAINRWSGKVNNLIPSWYFLCLFHFSIAQLKCECLKWIYFFSWFTPWKERTLSISHVAIGKKLLSFWHSKVTIINFEGISIDQS